MRLTTGTLVAGLAVSALDSAPRTESQPLSMTPAIERMAQWIEAVRAHEVGEADVQAVIVASWSHAELAEMFPLVEGLLQFVGRVVPESLRPRVARAALPAVRKLTSAEVDHLRGMAFFDWVRADPNRLLIRGGLLHADIARLVKPSVPEFVPPRSRAELGWIGRSATERVVARAPDADYRGMQYGLVHWDYARALLDAAASDSAAAQVVRSWYRATAAYMAGQYFFGEAKPHFEHALTLFPSDANLLFSHGCMQAAMASPGVQEFIEATTLPGGLYFDIGSARTHLRRAEDLFRRALKVDPHMVEARIRLARVRAELGRYEEAAAMLDAPVPEGTDATTDYYAQLFVGDVAVALRREHVARQAFQRAADLFPRAQTPRLALSQLARAADDGQGAVKALAAVLELGAEVVDRYDPWWDYHSGEGRYVQVLFAELRHQYELLQR